MTLAAVWWDFDGTLCDTEPLWAHAFRAYTARHAIPWGPDDQAKLHGGTLALAADVLSQAAGRVVSLAELQAEILPEVIAGVTRPEARHRELWDVVQAIHQMGIPQAIVSSSYRVVVDSFLSAVPEQLFRFTVCIDDVRRPKPDPEPYQQACERLGVDPARTVAVEDSPSGMAAARGAGCPVIGVHQGVFHSQLARAGFTEVAHRLALALPEQQ